MAVVWTQWPLTLTGLPPSMDVRMYGNAFFKRGPHNEIQLDEVEGGNYVHGRPGEREDNAKWRQDAELWAWLRPADQVDEEKL